MRNKMSEYVEVVIKMPEEVYWEIMMHNRELRGSGKSSYYLEGLIQNGTLLPKGHGALSRRRSRKKSQ